ncbi:hypothetical protein AtDm6_0680 [Acetobacter tropicalis]|uniref:Secreted protein n=1 Tax=Acetobacter tropicalis TaxID=104102 RepID=A0A094YTZ0_9PROT|nr:hypothetical protein AtDm6_0680 [Acetobacter tropicalis]
MARLRLFWLFCEQAASAALFFVHSFRAEGRENTAAPPFIFWGDRQPVCWFLPTLRRFQ